MKAVVFVLVAVLFVWGCAAPGGVAPRPEPEPGVGAPEQTDREPSRQQPQALAEARLLRIGLGVAEAGLLVSGSKAWTLHLQGGDRVARAGGGARLRIARLGAGVVEVIQPSEPAPIWTGTPRDTLILACPGGLVGWAGRWYRGALRIFATQPEGLTIVNVVDLEGYLRGVLPEEIGTPPESQFEAVKAQAVAARSYTLSYLGRRAELGFDLYASVEDQVYGGTARENPQSDRALTETRGEVLASEGAPIRALYSSTCGGRTANVEDVWPWPYTAYLRSVRDAEGPGSEPYCARSSSFRWSEEWPVPEFLDTVKRFAPAEGASPSTLAGDFLDVRVDSRGRSGRVSALGVSTTSGTTAVRGDRTRWVLRRPGGSAILRSSFFKIGVLRDARGRPLRVIATGAGNGHGIGMCQHGAMGMAQAGKTYREILNHYYRHTQLLRVAGG